MSDDGPIRDHDGPLQAVFARKGNLPRRIAQVAQFFLNDPEDVAPNTVVRLATLADVPPATITRFVQEFGFRGFPELQRVFRERLPGPRSRFAEQMTEVKAKGGMGEVDFTDPDAPGHVFDTMALGGAAGL